MQTFSCVRLTSRLTSSAIAWRGRRVTTRAKTNTSQRRTRVGKDRSVLASEAQFESDDDVISPETREAFRQLEAEMEEVEDSAEDAISPVTEERDVEQEPVKVPDYRQPHCFIGFDPRRMDLEDFPRLRTDFDGKRGGLIWMGTECQRCGLQIRRERRTNRESSLNVYANPGIPDELLRHCPKRKCYPVLWRTRDPYVALDVLGVEDC